MCPTTPEEIKIMRKVPYQSAIGSLMYAMMCTRPDICFAVSMISRYQSNPGQPHWKAVKRILRYLKGTMNYSLCYQRNNSELEGYSDADWGGDMDERKSTSGYVFLLNNGAISWSSKKQTCIALSTMEVEFVALSVAVQEAAGIKRVVFGIRHPLQHLRGNAVRALRSQGVQVDVLGEDLKSRAIEEARKACLLVNAPLICKAASRVPFSVLKYAMTLDGKIAASSGDSAWISSIASRQRVFELRGRSDAVIVGGNTVRRDDPELAARHGGGHTPLRVVMSRTLDLPEEAKIWDTSGMPTMVVTQRGARRSFQKLLALKGVEVVEFDNLNPRDVMEYFHDRGYLSVLWECGGTLAASAIGCGIVHKVVAVVAPKIIGGWNAPSPVGELGMVEMSQALELIDVQYEKVGEDMLISGFLHPISDVTPVIPSRDETLAADPTVAPCEPSIISFYNTWDHYGALSNFSPHAIHIANENGNYDTWMTVEHYYQAHKFVGVDDPLARDFVEKIKSTRTPEEAFKIARLLRKQRPDLVRSDWDTAKLDVMYRALKCKFTSHPSLKSMLLSTAGCVLVEASPHDLIWGGGRYGEGLNYLGRLLMQLRAELLGHSSKPSGDDPELN
ncbi:riboflavin biosynthesis protein PYRR, chloroplastic-like [Momordica charantia]|uniref:5-amino-6-(5-phosphoribosylamino)uracil reductase n=1 Tax=Momordica charantia TaxID=3673 RepID=A0A6J1D8N0_MOMCH|nr:riboflavin biosynthesis protein PYRR, chloroplastic-like [Momordica charantia]